MEVKDMPKVAVENNLTNVKEVLQDNGFEVVNLEGDNVPACDYCVISGQDENMMGMQDRLTEASIINASGLSAEQVLEQVRQRTEGT